MIVTKEIKRENGDVLQVNYNLLIENSPTMYQESFSVMIKAKGKKVFKPTNPDTRVSGKDKAYLTEEEVL
jgi:hypothetical protein